MADSRQDKRKYPRIFYSASVELISGTVKYYGIIFNISVGGLGVETEQKIPEGSSCVLKFSLANNFHLKTDGDVRWVLRKENSFIYGIEFRRLGMFTKIKLNSFINHLIKTNDTKKVSG